MQQNYKFLCISALVRGVGGCAQRPVSSHGSGGRGCCARQVPRGGVSVPWSMSRHGWGAGCAHWSPGGRGVHVGIHFLMSHKLGICAARTEKVVRIVHPTYVYSGL